MGRYKNNAYKLLIPQDFPPSFVFGSLGLLDCKPCRCNMWMNFEPEFCFSAVQSDRYRFWLFFLYSQTQAELLYNLPFSITQCQQEINFFFFLYFFQNWPTSALNCTSRWPKKIFINNRQQPQPVQTNLKPWRVILTLSSPANQIGWICLVGIWSHRWITSRGTREPWPVTCSRSRRGRLMTFRRIWWKTLQISQMPSWGWVLETSCGIW